MNIFARSPLLTSIRSTTLTEFDMGLVCAASRLFQVGEDTLAFDVLDMSQTVRVGNVDDLDKPMVRKWLKEKKRKESKA